MNTSRNLTGAIILLFVMLWVPIGQHDFLVDHWMKIGTYAIPFLLIGIFLFEANDRFSSCRFIGALLLIAYIIHQFEEHWIDIYGNYYSFYEFNNNFILSNLGAPNSTIRPLTKEAIFMINTSLVWLVGVLGILSSPRHLFPLFAMASIIIVNGFVHVLAAIATFRYNPGLFDIHRTIRSALPMVLEFEIQGESQRTQEADHRRSYMGFCCSHYYGGRLVVGQLV